MKKKKSKSVENPVGGEVQAVKSDSWAAKEEDHEARHLMEKLLDAEEIKADPEKMKRIHAAMEKRAGAMRSIEDLKHAYKAKFEK